MSNKRQRTTESLHITDLPDGILVGISSYLAKPSVALFALAMNSSQQTETSKAIISSINWNVLDFSDIEKSLAAKLSDDDINKILKSIDAVNNLRILKLAGCINITGSGLDVLRLSTVLEQIDLSLVGKHEVPLIEPEPLLSEDVVLPILDSIVSRGRRSSLKQLELPKKWRMEQSTQLDQFLRRYDDYMSNQRYCCSKCEQVIYCDDWTCLDGDKWHGTQNYTCSGCLKHFCYDDDCIGEDFINWCQKCEKGYCNSCAAHNSDELLCMKCVEL
jgi:hypothetical protein